MPSMKAIKRRRLTVKNIQHITKAMNLVATSKLQRARTNLRAVKPLVDETNAIMRCAASHEDAQTHAFIDPRPVVKSIAYVLITSDRGLCGGYNGNISKALIAHAKREGKDAKIITVGTKGRDFLRRRQFNVIESFNSPTETATFSEASKVGPLVTSLYASGEVDEVYVAYTKFESVLTQEPRIEKILPLSSDSTDAADKNSLMEYEPDLHGFLDHMVPMYLNVFIFGAMVESVICEQAARMTSMDAATKNADDIIEKLTLLFNRQRQSSITQEITEIVSGANALQ